MEFMSLLIFLGPVDQVSLSYFDQNSRLIWFQHFQLCSSGIKLRSLDIFRETQCESQGHKQQQWGQDLEHEFLAEE